jgi:hypothetical protein
MIGQLFTSTAASGQFEWRQMPGALGFRVDVVVSGVETADIDLLSAASEEPANPRVSVLPSGPIVGASGSTAIESDDPSRVWRLSWQNLSGGSITAYIVERAVGGV